MTGEVETPEHKKMKIDEVQRDKGTRDMSDIITLISLAADDKRMELVSRYIQRISEFVLHKAEEMCKADKRKAISKNDIMNVIVSENLFYLSDLLDLSK